MDINRKIKISLTKDELITLHNSIELSLKRIDDWEFPALTGQKKEYTNSLEITINGFLNHIDSRSEKKHEELIIELTEKELLNIYYILIHCFINKHEKIYSIIMGGYDKYIDDVLDIIKKTFFENGIDL